MAAVAAPRTPATLPVTALIPIAANDTTGTTVRFLPDETQRAVAAVTVADLAMLTVWPHLSVDVVDERNR